MQKYKYSFQIKCKEAILSNISQKLLRFEITKMHIAVKNNFIASFIIIFGTLSFPIEMTVTSSRVVTRPYIVSYDMLFVH